jgi:hypothetical protein|tara:strand:- start:283 stop:564 length:282 start_codon:yes stop_codon:yes gene_type:complete
MSSRIFKDDDLRPVPFSKQELEQLIRSCNACACHQKQWREDLIERIEEKEAMGEGDYQQLIHHIDTEMANTVLANSIAHRMAHCFPSDQSNND